MAHRFIWPAVWRFRSRSPTSVPVLIWPPARGLDVPIALRDWLDRPVPGAGVGLCLGSGHTPDVVHATADEQGIAVLRGNDPHRRRRQRGRPDAIVLEIVRDDRPRPAEPAPDARGAPAALA